MNNEEEKRCPLCAEEMDWTDQQFKPCKCGYQVCVWCWHQIMDMAEKGESEGRCPACRSFYEKDKIATMQANCERAVTKICNKKSKPPKAKPKTTEVKDLSNVRVIQRKMAYIVGLPTSIADENVLLRKEHFGQYGKIVKISLSRTASGAIQQFPNDTCSVSKGLPECSWRKWYVTYSKEEEAVRCIRSVHSFFLEDKFLRASFGTAKYCHAWLRNTPCNNPACLYLHTIGPEEDSFGKDEIAAIHTRNRVQQIVGAADNVPKRWGSSLPSPVDEPSNGSSGFTERITLMRSSSDSAHSGDLTGNIGAPNTMTSFVDIVGRASNSSADKDIMKCDDRRLLDLGADLSKIKLEEDNLFHDAYSNCMQYTLPFSSNLATRSSDDSNSREFSDDAFTEDVLHYEDPLPKDFCNLSDEGCFHQSSYPAKVSEDSSGPSTFHERKHSSSNISTDQNSVHSLEDEASLPLTCVHSVLNERTNESKFQSSAKSDRIYQSSNSFSNEEIVEHLLRIGDNDLTNGEEISSSGAVENSIISNVLSMGFDDSLALPRGLSEILDECDDRHCSSWNPYTSGKSGFSFVKEDGSVDQLSTHRSSLNNLGQVSITCSGAKDYGGNLDGYLSNPQYHAPSSPSLAPPGFSLPCRVAPPGFSTFEQMGRVQNSPSGGLGKNSPLPDRFHHIPSVESNAMNGDVDLVDPVILSCGKGKPMNGFENNPVFGTRPSFNNQSSSFDQEAKLLHHMQQPFHHDQYLNHSGSFFQPTPSTHNAHIPTRGGDKVSAFDDVYGFPPRLIHQSQTYDLSSLLQTSQLKLGNGHISNGHCQHSFDELVWKNGAGTADIQRNERLGLDNYFSGYGDLVYQMASPGFYNGALNM